MIVFVAGTRPNFVKMAPIVKQFQKHKIPFLFCHTNQHYDPLMSRNIIRDLGLPEPDFYEIKNIPKGAKWLIIFGDVNGSREAAEYALEKNIKVIHIESGLRSFDNSMPEERNRIIIDRISDICFCTEESGVNNLMNEKSLKPQKVFLVGNTMIDSLASHHINYILLTLHRPSNVDDPIKLDEILSTLSSIGITIIFPKHHRVHIKHKYPNIIVERPSSYNEFIEKMLGSSLIITDSGGVQEEAAYLGRKCLTLRENTERPITFTYGNELVDLQNVKKRVESLMKISLWDGKAAERIFEILKNEKII